MRTAPYLEWPDERGMTNAELLTGLKALDAPKEFIQWASTMPVGESARKIMLIGKTDWLLWLISQFDINPDAMKAGISAAQDISTDARAKYSHHVNEANKLNPWNRGIRMGQLENAMEIKRRKALSALLDHIYDQFEVEFVLRLLWNPK